jgi:hypothetical protein
MITCLPVNPRTEFLNWWDPGAVGPVPSPYSPELDRSPWYSAYRRGFYQGVSEEAQFLAFCQDPAGVRHLYLSWRVQFAPASSPYRDRLHLAFASGETAVPLLLEIVVYGEDTDLLAQPAASVSVGERDAQGHFRPLPRTPAWITRTTRVWRDLDRQQWAVQMMAPLVPGAAPADDAGLGVAADGTFRLWYGFDLYAPLNPAGPSADPAGAIVRLAWPPGAGFELVDGARAWPTAADCEQYGPGRSEPPSCPGGGLGLSWMTMGTPSAPASLIDPDRPVTLFARPQNQSGATVAAGQVRGRFAFADWGAPGDAAAPWTAIAADVANTGPIADRSAPVPGQDIRVATPLPAALAEDIRVGTRPANQCVRVDLSVAGLGVLTTPWYRNMDIVGASRFTREARIGVLGLEPLPGGSRDIYLAVETRNLPERIAPTAGTRAALPALSALSGRAAAPADPVQQLTDDINAYAFDQGMVPTPEVLQFMLDTLFPTWRVHCYRDTGQREPIDGRSFLILGLHGSFGYHLVPQGDLVGWSHRLRGAVRLAEHFYVLAVPNQGVARITTTIAALAEGDPVEPDEPIQPWPGTGGSRLPRLPWWAVALALLALAVLLRLL